MRYVFDLDGTICTQENSGEYYLARPIPEMVKKVNELYDAGNDIVIYTARGMTRYNGDADKASARYREETEDWLYDNHVQWHELIMGKPSGDFYIDDKGVTPQEFLYHVD